MVRGVPYRQASLYKWWGLGTDNTMRISKNLTCLRNITCAMTSRDTPELLISMVGLEDAISPDSCRHSEDMELHSVNYLHYGAPKHWYCIPPEHSGRFEEWVKGMVPDCFRQCSEFFRHKVRMQARRFPAGQTRPDHCPRMQASISVGLYVLLTNP